MNLWSKSLILFVGCTWFVFTNSFYSTGPLVKIARRTLVFSSLENDDDGLDELADMVPLKKMRASAGTKKTKKAKPKPIPLKPEFSRVLNIGSVPEKRPVLCKLLAKPSECAGLAERFDIPELSYFSANVTVRRQDPYTILVEGSIEAHISAGSKSILPPQEIFSSFETLVLDTISGTGGMSFDDATDYDDEVAANGDIDIGEIAAQYFSLELFS